MVEHECPNCGMHYICGDPTCDLRFKELHHKVINKTLVGCELIQRVMKEPELKTETETRLVQDRKVG